MTTFVALRSIGRIQAESDKIEEGTAMRVGIIWLGLVAVTATGAATARPAPRPQWVRVGTHVDGGPIEVDKSSVAPSHGLWRGWWRVTFAEPRPDGTAAEKHLELVDCGQRLSSSVEVVSLAGDGRMLNDAREPESVVFNSLSPPTPDTAGDMAAAGICRLRPPPPRPKHH